MQPSRNVWHVRGNWSTRDDRVPSAVWLGILWVGMIAGFGVDISGFRQAPYAPLKVIWVHAFVFTVWMFILTAQVLFVLRDRVGWHRKFGWFAAGWAGVMAVMGPWAAIVAQVVSLRTQFSDPAFLSVQLLNIIEFLTLLAWGITLRKNPAAHRRVMILSTIALADPGFSRFSGWLWPTEPSSPIVAHFYIFYGNILLIVLMAAWDWWRGRLIRSFIIGAVALLTCECVSTILYFWPPWKAATTEFVQSWASHFA
jgi:hypothetical protein